MFMTLPRGAIYAVQWNQKIAIACLSLRIINMTKSRAEDNKRLRQRRKDAGLVHYRVWVTESEKRALEDALRFMRIIKEK